MRNLKLPMRIEMRGDAEPADYRQYRIHGNSANP